VTCFQGGSSRARTKLSPMVVVQKNFFDGQASDRTKVRRRSGDGEESQVSRLLPKFQENSSWKRVSSWNWKVLAPKPTFLFGKVTFLFRQEGGDLFSGGFEPCADQTFSEGRRAEKFF
jgi:hypothetical protein